MKLAARAAPFRRLFALVFALGLWALTPSTRLRAQNSVAPEALPNASASAESFRGRVLRVGTDATYPPFETVRDGEFSGFSMDLGRALAAEMGARVEYVNTGFDGIFPALLSGKFDMVISSVTITDERKKRLAFSDSYYTAGQIVAVRRDSTLTSLQQLNGKTAGIQINTTASEVLKPFPQIGVRKYPTIDLALQDLQNGNLDGVVGDAPTIRYFLAHGFGGLKTVGDMLTREQYGIVMRPQDSALRQSVNEALGRLRANGQFAALETKYFGAAAQAAQQASSTRNEAFPRALLLRTLARGLGLTLLLTFCAICIGLPLGLLLSLGRLRGAKPLRWLCATYVEIWRGTPLLVQIIFVYYALPTLIGLDLRPLPAAITALSLNSAAYISEIFRAGISSIDVGQSEAARSLGMSYAQSMRFVVLPQALRRVLPPLTNETIAMLKDSSLVSVIGMAELTRSGQEMASLTAAPIAVWTAVALFYLAVTFPLTRLANRLERRWEVTR